MFKLYHVVAQVTPLLHVLEEQNTDRVPSRHDKWLLNTVHCENINSTNDLPNYAKEIKTTR